MNIFRLAAMLTLLIDGYLLLALVATSRMKAEYHSWLPPFGYDFVDSILRIAFVMLAGWTGFLAIGCLCSGRRRTRSEK